jgi:hypothetical protein
MNTPTPYNIEEKALEIGHRYGNFEFSDHAGQKGHDNLVRQVRAALQEAYEAGWSKHEAFVGRKVDEEVGAALRFLRAQLRKEIFKRRIKYAPVIMANQVNEMLDQIADLLQDQPPTDKP